MAQVSAIYQSKTCIMNIPFRPLGEVRDIVQATGLDISYAYEDLVFSDHSVFILRFADESTKKLYLYFNTECIEREANALTQKLITAGKVTGFEILKAGSFKLTQASEIEEIEITFLN